MVYRSILGTFVHVSEDVERWSEGNVFWTFFCIFRIKWRVRKKKKRKRNRVPWIKIVWVGVRGRFFTRWPRIIRKIPPRSSRETCHSSFIYSPSSSHVTIAPRISEKSKNFFQNFEIIIPIYTCIPICSEIFFPELSNSFF